MDETLPCPNCGRPGWTAAGTDGWCKHREPEVPQHTVNIEFDRGWPTARMICPFEVTDDARPCWPHEEDGERSTPGDFCNWEAWFGEGGLDCVSSGHVEMLVAKVEWDGDGFLIRLAAKP